MIGCVPQKVKCIALANRPHLRPIYAASTHLQISVTALTHDNAATTLDDFHLLDATVLAAQPRSVTSKWARRGVTALLQLSPRCLAVAGARAPFDKNLGGSPRCGSGPRSGL